MLKCDLCKEPTNGKIMGCRYLYSKEMQKDVFSDSYGWACVDCYLTKDEHFFFPQDEEEPIG